MVKVFTPYQKKNLFYANSFQRSNSINKNKKQCYQNVKILFNNILSDKKPFTCMLIFR
jgi:hypothetical protein